MGRFYSKHLGPTLKKQLEEFLEGTHDEQVQLYEELAMSRTMAVQAVKLAGAALENGRVDGDGKGLAIDVVQRSLSLVKDFVLAAAKLENDSKNTVTLRALDLFITQILRSIHVVLKDDEEKAMMIEAHVRENVRLPSARDPNVSLDGVVSSPADVVRDMDQMMEPPGDDD